MAGMKPPVAARLMWFVGLWVAGVLAVALVGYGIKLMLGA